MRHLLKPRRNSALMNNLTALDEEPLTRRGGHGRRRVVRIDKDERSLLSERDAMIVPPQCAGCLG